MGILIFLAAIVGIYGILKLARWAKGNPATPTSHDDADMEAEWSNAIR